MEEEAYNPALYQERLHTLRTLRKLGVSRKRLKNLVPVELAEVMAAFVIDYDENNVEMFATLTQFMIEFCLQNVIQCGTISAMSNEELQELITAITDYFEHAYEGSKLIWLQANLRCFVHALQNDSE